MVRIVSYLVICSAAAIFVIMVTFNIRPSESSSPTFVVENGYSGYDNDKRVSFHYGVVIDAGSSGSRVFVYIWPSETQVRNTDLIKIMPLQDEETGRPVVKKVSPGLSSYGENTTGAVAHAMELLNYASSKIPKEKHKETSLFLMATAGMRLIPESQQQAVMKALRDELPKLCDFIIMDQHIEIISGKWEGIYSWIAVNYALQRFDNTKSDPTLEMVPVYDDELNKTMYRKPTVGMVDMGGGSVQIAFETTEKVPRMQEHMTVDLNLGYEEHDSLHQYKLYVTTFLGFGANIAITKYEKKLIEQLTQPKSDSSDESTTSLSVIEPPVIKDPCLPVNLYKTVSLLDSSGGKSNTATQKLNSYARKGIGNFDQCQIALKELLNIMKTCPQNPCSFDGIYQPLINFSSMEFYGFSEYWYTTNDVLDVSGPYSYAKFRTEAAKFCGTKWSSLKQAFDKKLYPRADAQRMRTECFKAAWISTVLHDGFGFPRTTTKFKTVSHINNEEVQWTIGALLYRMRHFPLREMQRLREMQLQPPRYKRPSANPFVSLVPSDTLSQLLLLACIVVVVLAAMKYFCVLRRYKRLVLPGSNRNGGLQSSNMPRNRSIYSYMTMDDPTSKETAPFLQGVRVEQSGYIY